VSTGDNLRRLKTRIFRICDWRSVFLAWVVCRVLYLTEGNVVLRHHPCLSVSSYFLILSFVLNLMWMLNP
jgi:hypothetical protein